MSTIRNPVGPQPSRVYWRRRLLVGLGLLASILIVVLILVRPGADALPTASPTVPSTTAPPTSANGTESCDPSDIDVTAVTDAVRYDKGVEPLLSLTVTNTGAAACTMMLGSDVQEYRITSGSELIWSSRDCQTDPVEAALVLQPDESVSNTPIPWDRTRSSTSTCDDDRQRVTADGASYHLTVIVDGIESDETKQFLLF